MGLQKYRADAKRAPTKNGAIDWVANWIGGPSLSKIENCPCDDFRVTRRMVYITGEADTWYSIPAKAKWHGFVLDGYVTGTDDGPVFCLMNYSSEMIDRILLSRALLARIQSEIAAIKAL